MDFPREILTPQKVIVKAGSAAALAAETLELGPRGLIVHGRSFTANGARDRVAKTFSSSQVQFFERPPGEPVLDEITQVIEAGKNFKASWIAGAGGGSVLDLAKAAAGLFHASRPPVYYQEGGALEEKGIPFVAVPTTAGTGSEATPNSVIINPRNKTKLSIRDKSFMARKVILDAELLRGLPRDVMSYSAMDALVQAYESFISRNANWYSNAHALKAIELINRHLPQAFRSQDIQDLEALLVGSYLAGVALASARLGVIHGIAHPLGVLYDQPHGLICSVCFVPSIRLNREVMGKKYDIMTQTVGMDLLVRAEHLIEELEIRSPFRGRPVLEKEKIIRETLASGSTAANPRPVTREDVEFLLAEIFRPAQDLA